MDEQEALDIRFKQRQQYLEDPNFERLSDILKDEWGLRRKRDNYILVYLLCGSNDRPSGNYHLYDEMEQLFLEQYKRNSINWNGIYQYYQERKKSINKGEWNSTLNPENNETETDLELVLELLKKHKDKILTTYETF